MAVTLTYDNTLARVRITANGLNAADSATVDRSTDGLQWTTVRGASSVSVAGGVMSLTVDDYEFVDGVPNTYRVRGAASAAAAFVGVGTSSTGNNTSVTPGLPAGVAADDLVLIHASIRNSASGGFPNTPAGWTLLQLFGNQGVFGRVYDGVWTMPTVTFSNGVASSDTIAESAAFRRTGMPAVTAATLLSTTAQNIAYPAMTPAAAGVEVLAVWKQDDWTTVGTPAGWTFMDQTISTAGADTGQAWWYQLQSTPVTIPAGSIVVTGGGTAISRATLLALPHADYINTETAQITPQLGAVWLKDIARPYLNRPIQVIMPEDTPVTRAPRDGVFDVVGRSFPIAVTDVRGPKQWALQLRTATSDEANTIDAALSTGDPMFVHVPAGCQVLGGYVRIGQTSQTWSPLRPDESFFTLPLTAVAAPGPDVVGSTSTWATVLATYASWSALIAGKATWKDVLELIGSPSEVIVP